MTIQDFLQNLFNAIAFGSLYALIAIGYTMVYGILRLINFAHGDIFMLGAYLAIYGIAFTGMPWWLVFILAALLTGAIGVLLEKFAYAPLRNAPRITVLISAIGASFLLQNMGVLIFGGRPKVFPVPAILDKTIFLGDIRLKMVQIVIPLITIILLAILSFIIKKTKFGIAMRALSKDFEATSLMGVNINAVISITFFIGSFLAAIGGMLYSTRYPSILPTMGIMPGLKCFIAAVIGGIGSLSGAVMGGLLLGLIEILLVAFFPALSPFRDGFAFILLILILLVKPTGIMGSTVKEKV